jgi:hypothetical protein
MNGFGSRGDVLVDVAIAVVIDTIDDLFGVGVDVRVVVIAVIGVRVVRRVREHLALLPAEEAIFIRIQNFAGRDASEYCDNHQNELHLAPYLCEGYDLKIMAIFRMITFKWMILVTKI